MNEAEQRIAWALHAIEICHMSHADEMGVSAEETLAVVEAFLNGTLTPAADEEDLSPTTGDL